MLLGFFNDNQWTYLKPPKPLNNALFLVTLTATASKGKKIKSTTSNDFKYYVETSSFWHNATELHRPSTAFFIKKKTL